jgi:ABC-type branched-subunit amino acid transport system substrate-binding protein
MIAPRSSGRRRRALATVTLLLIASVLAACSDDDEGSGSAESAGTTQPGASTATTEPAELEAGVTETTLEIGVMVLDLPEDLRELIGIDPEFTEAAYTAYFDEINSRGGVGGRQIEPVFERLNLVSPTGATEDRRVCLVLTEDKPTFAVLMTAAFDDEVPCIVDEHDTIFIHGQGLPEFQYEAAPERLFTIDSSSDQALRDFVAAMADDLEGKKVAVVWEDAPGEEAINDTLLPTLEDAGLDVVHVFGVNDDSNIGATEMPLEITEMKNAGVDAVILNVAVVPNISNFITEAAAQGFTPQYYASDYYGATADSAIMPEQWNGAIGTSQNRRYGKAPATEANETACFDVLEGAGMELPEPGTLFYGEALQICAMVQVLERGLTGAGDTPTRDGFAAAIHGLGDVELPMKPVASFEPGKNWGGGGTVQVIEFDHSCPCWVQTRDFEDVSSQ